VAHELGSDHAAYLVQDGDDNVHKNGFTQFTINDVIGRSRTVTRFLQERAIKAVILGTSEGVTDNDVERILAAAAKQAGVPVFIIEDFPGNYQPGPNERLDGLFVEDDLMVPVYTARGIPPSRIHPTGNPRYDKLKMLDRSLLRARSRAALGLSAQRAVLWAGQPDGLNSLRTFERLVPFWTRSDFYVLFRAHPRDGVYLEGKYRSILSTLEHVVDVTTELDLAGLCCAVDLVVTQFSSVGVEASHLGTPTVYALFDDLGKTYLEKHKGCSSVPWVRHGGAFLIDSSSDVLHVMNTALFDQAERQKVIENFRERYGNRMLSAGVIMATIRRELARHSWAH